MLSANRAGFGFVRSEELTESVFAVPGIGRLMVDSIFARDYPVIQCLTLVLALLVSIAFLVTDLIQGWLDPRVSR